MANGLVGIRVTAYLARPCLRLRRGEPIVRRAVTLYRRQRGQKRNVGRDADLRN